MTTVFVASPYAGDIAKNVRYAWACVADSLMRGEAPFAPHLLYTEVLDDADPEMRMWGMDAGKEWLKKAQKLVLYVDFGNSPGMLAEESFARMHGVPVERRTIPEVVAEMIGVEV